MSKNVEREYWKPAELAKMLRVDGRVIYGMIERGELEAIRLGRVLRIPADALARLSAKKPPGKEPKGAARGRRQA
jgi:excisionase family DNA binding protein